MYQMDAKPAMAVKSLLSYLKVQAGKINVQGLQTKSSDYHYALTSEEHGIFGQKNSLKLPMPDLVEKVPGQDVQAFHEFIDNISPNVNN